MRTQTTFFALSLLLPAAAFANPRPLPFTYPYETQPQGGIELEQFADLTNVLTEHEDGSSEWSAAYALITEFEYGITDRLEGAFYFVAKTEPGEAALIFDGIKQRLRYRLLDPGEGPIDVSLYAEIAELHDEIELEVKINVQKRLGPVRLMFNFSGERAFDFHGGGDWTLNPSGGVAWEVTPWLSLGLEYWMKAVLDEPLVHYAGPTVMVQWRRLWLSAAPYLRLDNIGVNTASNDPFGKFWFRAVLGINL